MSVQQLCWWHNCSQIITKVKMSWQYMQIITALFQAGLKCSSDRFIHIAKHGAVLIGWLKRRHKQSEGTGRKGGKDIQQKSSLLM